MTTKTNEKVIDRIKKLIALGGSSNAHEAQNALALAAKLMMQNNIAQDQLEDRQYDKQELEGMKRMPTYYKSILTIISEFYGVECILSKRSHRSNGRIQSKTDTTLIGEKTNIELAKYLIAHLNRLYPSLFTQYRKETGCPLNYRASFYTGLTRGIKAQLRQAKQSFEQENSLVIVRDANLDKEVAKHFPKLKHTSIKHQIRSHQALQAGKNQGQNINLNRPIASNSTMQKLLV